MNRQPRFEIVRGDHGYHARFRAANGRIVWTTEVYQRRGKALNAIRLLAGWPVCDHGGWLEVPVTFGISDFGLLEVREVDEREGGAA